MTKRHFQGLALSFISTLTLAPHVSFASARDLDEDGWPNFLDCKQRDASVYPGAPEVADGKDNDCDGVIDEGTTANTAPTITITSPISGGSIGLSPGEIFATVKDNADAAGAMTYSLTTSVGTVSNVLVDDLTSTSVVASGDFDTCGAQTLSLTVTDKGNLSATATVAVVADDVPIAVVTSPSAGASVAEGFSISVSGLVLEGPCGDDPAGHEIAWEVDGVEEFSGFPEVDGSSNYTIAPLEAGDHTISFVAYDAAGLIGSDTIVITVAADTSCDSDLDPAAWYTMDEGSGLTLDDVSSFNNSATLVGSPTWLTSATGSLGLAVNFDGVDDYATAPHNSSLNATNEVTVMAWIQLDTLPPMTTYAPNRNWYLITSKGEGEPAPLNRNYSFYVAHNNGESSGRLHLSMTNPNSSSAAYRSYSTPLLNTGTWYHVVARATEANGGTITYFIDGEKDVAGETINVGNVGGLVTNSQPLYIGRTPQQGIPYFDGRMDDLRIYPCGLTDTEIALVYESTTL